MDIYLYIYVTKTVSKNIFCFAFEISPALRPQFLSFIFYRWASPCGKNCHIQPSISTITCKFFWKYRNISPHV